MCGKKCHLQFLSKKFFFVVLTRWKRNAFQISMKFHLKKRENNFETFFSPPFHILHSSPMVYMNHTELIFQNLLLYCTKKVQDNQNHFFHFVHGGETHFVVLAQTLIKIKVWTSTRKCVSPPWQKWKHL